MNNEQENVKDIRDDPKILVVLSNTLMKLWKLNLHPLQQILETEIS